MNRFKMFLSVGCYLAACYLPAVNVREYGQTVLSLTGWECLAFLPRILESLPGTFLLLFAWLANPFYLRSLVSSAVGSPRCHGSFLMTLGLALSFLLYAIFSMIGTNMHIQPGPGCILWYCSMAVGLWGTTEMDERTTVPTVI